MSALDETHALDWEDSDPASGRWWISRARDVTEGAARDFFVAEDDMTDALLGLLRVPPQSHYTVLAAAFLDRFESRAAAAAAVKDDIANALAHGDKARSVAGALRTWRVIRVVTIARKNLPFVLLGLAAGALLGLAVALFTVWTGFVGWPIVAAGIALGAATGFLMKLAVEAYRAKAVAGPWGRFAIIMLSAIAGAGLTAGGALVLFWH
ncbi:MAG: hypothetical protein IT566_09905 [Rhodospirillaceae bacterium]|nr:hypothetical protein [Rhodospirillaceae bacterium]